jgi:hypothetical protein
VAGGRFANVAVCWVHIRKKQAQLMWNLGSVAYQGVYGTLATIHAMVVVTAPSMPLLKVAVGMGGKPPPARQSINAYVAMDEQVAGLGKRMGRGGTGQSRVWLRSQGRGARWFRGHLKEGAKRERQTRPRLHRFGFRRHVPLLVVKTSMCSDQRWLNFPSHVRGA